MLRVARNTMRQILHALIKDDYAPLFTAADEQDVPTFKKLIKKHPTWVNAVNDIGTPILYKTFLVRNIDMAASLLLHKDADRDVSCTIAGKHLSLLVHAVAVFDKDFIGLLIKNGASTTKEVGGLSVKKVLENPEQYRGQLFESVESPGAKNFLEKAAAIKGFIDALQPQIIGRSEGSCSTASFDAANLIRSRKQDGLLGKPIDPEDIKGGKSVSQCDDSAVNSNRPLHI